MLDEAAQVLDAATRSRLPPPPAPKAPPATPGQWARAAGPARRRCCSTTSSAAAGWGCGWPPLFIPATGTPLLVELGWLPVPADRSIPPLTTRRRHRRWKACCCAFPGPGRRGDPAAGRRQPAADGAGPGSRCRSAWRGRIAARAAPGRTRPAATPATSRSCTLPPEQHLGYAVQWYGLALAVLATALILTFRRRRSPQVKPDP